MQREEEDAVKGQAVKEEALKTNDMANEKQIKEYKVTDENKHLAQVDSSLTLDLDYTSIAKSGTPERKKYENQIANDFSHSLGIHKDRFEIKSIKSGSVIIDFSILPSSDGSGMIAEEAATLLEKQVSDLASALYTSPNIQILKAVNAAKNRSIELSGKP